MLMMLTMERSDAEMMVGSVLSFISYGHRYHHQDCSTYRIAYANFAFLATAACSLCLLCMAFSWLPFS